MRLQDLERGALEQLGLEEEAFPQGEGAFPQEQEALEQQGLGEVALEQQALEEAALEQQGLEEAAFPRVEEALASPEQGQEEEGEGGLREAVESVLLRPPCAAPCSVQKRLGFNIPRRVTQ